MRYMHGINAKLKVLVEGQSFKTTINQLRNTPPSSNWCATEKLMGIKPKQQCA